jgi:hypothetical protein
MVSVDFFTVPTIRFEILYVFLVLAHERRRIVHFAVTAHPNAEWRPNRTATTTSAISLQRAMISGRLSMPPFQIFLAWSYSGSSDRIRDPLKSVRNVANWSSSKPGEPELVT